MKHWIFRNRFITSSICLLLVFPFYSCKKEISVRGTDQPTDLTVSAGTHSWYYFTKDSFKPIDLPENAPDTVEDPWTEALRISASGTTEGNGTNSISVSYAIVNRLGLLLFKDGKPELFSDPSVFKGKTAGNLVFYDSTPVFSLYKNSIFNTDEPENNQNLRPFLVQFRPDSGIFYPIISYANLGLPETAEITDVSSDGKTWLCCVKDSPGTDRIKFSYIKWTTNVPLLSLSPQSAETALRMEKTDESSFRTAELPRPFSEAPDRLTKLLQTIPESFPFYVEYSKTGGTSPVIYEQKNAASQGTPVHATACIAKTWTAAVFSDGTVYLNGALKDHRIFANGKTAAFLLPELSAGYSYGYFGISGSIMFVSWEQTDFYKTARSGFITVDLDKILYGNGI